jgi:hypothetical protein
MNVVGADCDAHHLVVKHNLMALQVLVDSLALLLDHHLLAMHEVLDPQPFA